MGQRILIVDDNLLNRRLATAMLSRHGWETAEAIDGLQALKMLEGAHGYHAVLLDISMPNMNGDEVCRLLRADPRTADLPIIAYTAHALEEDRERMLAAGFDAIATKPVSLTSLMECIGRAMASRSAE
jgi:CheY-like chemotaxis protein